MSTEQPPVKLSLDETDLSLIRKSYVNHRQTRQSTQTFQFKTPGTTLSPDPTLTRLLREKAPDPRNCLALWATPPKRIARLASEIQERLAAVIPNAWEHWMMPLENLHLNVVDVTYEQEPEVVARLIEKIRPHRTRIADYTLRHRARLVKPLVTYDRAAFALTFVPAMGEGVYPHEDTMSAAEKDVSVAGDTYNHHMLRNGLTKELQNIGVKLKPRYQFPTAHITLGRFIGESREIDPDSAAKWTQAIDDINEWLKTVFHRDEGTEADWYVGEERGIDIRYGPIWYGGGRSLIIGEGF